MPTPLRLSQLIALAICIGMGLAFAIANAFSWQLEDAEAYWNAALRLRSGGDLYVAVPLGADETIAYRYAPWLAWLWIPLTYLPQPSCREFGARCCWPLFVLLWCRWYASAQPQAGACCFCWAVS